MRKRSVFNSIDKDILVSIVKKSDSMKQVFEFLGLTLSGTQYRILNKLIKKFEVDCSHFGSKRVAPLKMNDDVFFTKGIHRGNASIKKRLSDLGHSSFCSSCGNEGEWMGKKLSIQIDHINGDRLDSRIENLRFLCPNCHSQTATYAGKRIRKHYNCKLCMKKIQRSSEVCKQCSPKFHKTHEKQEKISWPTNEELQKLVIENPLTILKLALGVSDNAIKKRCKVRGIYLPNQSERRKNYEEKKNGAVGGY